MKHKRKGKKKSAQQETAPPSKRETTVEQKPPSLTDSLKQIQQQFAQNISLLLAGNAHLEQVIQLFELAASKQQEPQIDDAAQPRMWT